MRVLKLDWCAALREIGFNIEEGGVAKITGHMTIRATRPSDSVSLLLDLDRGDQEESTEGAAKRFAPHGRGSVIHLVWGFPRLLKATGRKFLRLQRDHSCP